MTSGVDDNKDEGEEVEQPLMFAEVEVLNSIHKVLKAKTFLFQEDSGIND